MRCPNCSADLSFSDEVCPVCNTPRPQLPPAFNEARNKFIALQQSHHAGEMDKATFEAEVKKLMIRDQAEAAWWLGGEVGQWHRHDGDRWVPQDPPLVSGMDQTPTPPIKPTQSKSKFRWPLLLIPAALLLLCICAVVLVVAGVFPGISELLVQNTETTEVVQSTQVEPAAVPGTSHPDETRPPVAVARVTFSDDQQLLIDEFGWPDSFTILEADTDTGTHVRYENWTYYRGKISFTFFDGVFQVEGDVERLPSGFIPAPHHPDQFPLGASPGLIEALLPGHTLVPQENSEAIGAGVQMFVAQQVVLGFLDDRLFYVDALAFIPEGSEQ